MCVACRGFTVENKQAENPVREGVIEGTLRINQQTLSNCQYMHTFQMDAAEFQVQQPELSDVKQAQATEQAKEQEDDPGIIIVYTMDETIHQALGQPGSPVPQGPNAGASSIAFQEFVQREILASTNLSVDNCIRKSSNSYFPNLFHRLPQDDYYAVMQVLGDRFCQGMGPIAQWSTAVSAPPNPPLGAVLRVGGGVGVGGVHFYRELIQQGVFRST